MANINNNGRTPVAGMVHAIVLALVLVILMPYAKMIPMPTIAAILINVAYNMSHWKPFTNVVKKAPKSDIAVLVTTFVLTVVFDLVIAIEFGLILTAALFIKRMTDEANIRKWEEDSNRKELPANTEVYELNGAMFFSVSGLISEIIPLESTKTVILRMSTVYALDITALKALEEVFDKLNSKGIRVIFSHLNSQPLKTFEKYGLDVKVGKENLCENIDVALELASK